MNRGGTYLAGLGGQIGHEQATTRPVLIVSAQPWLDSNPPVVTVLPLTRTRRGSPTHVEIEPGASGLRATSYAKCEDIRAISLQSLTRSYGYVDEVVLARIRLILQRLLTI